MLIRAVLLPLFKHPSPCYNLSDLSMGNTACCGNNEQELNLNLGPQDNLYQARYFHLYPQAKATFDRLNLPENNFPANLKKISRHSVTEFKEEGIFIGKECRVRHGLGIMVYEAEGLYYIGNWINGNRQGLGFMLYRDGCYYQGQWYQNQPHGYGEYYSADRKWFYKGKWKVGAKEGLGEETYPDGTIFKGHYHEGTKEGEGIIIFTTDCQYDDRDANSGNLKVTTGGRMKCCFKGTFKADIACGYGVQKGENYKYEGIWQNNQMHGAGKSTYYDKDGKVSQCYIGEFKNGLKDGFGQYRWVDGRIYKGEWEAGEMVSRGVFIDNRG